MRLQLRARRKRLARKEESTFSMAGKQISSETVQTAIPESLGPNPLVNLSLGPTFYVAHASPSTILSDVYYRSRCGRRRRQLGSPLPGESPRTPEGARRSAPTPPQVPTPQGARGGPNHRTRYSYLPRILCLSTTRSTWFASAQSMRSGGGSGGVRLANLLSGASPPMGRGRRWDRYVTASFLAARGDRR